MKITDFILESCSVRTNSVFGTDRIIKPEVINNNNFPLEVCNQSSFLLAASGLVG